MLGKIVTTRKSSSQNICRLFGGYPEVYGETFTGFEPAEVEGETFTGFDPAHVEGETFTGFDPAHVEGETFTGFDPAHIEGEMFTGFGVDMLRSGTHPQHLS
jgi:hypothetical protein